MKNIIPIAIKNLLDDVAYQFKNLLKDNFVGFYIHGSIAMGCFNFQESDIDFLVIVEKNLDKSMKRKIIDLLLKATEKAPPKGFEMSIIKQSELDDFKYPTPFELHFSGSNIEKYRTDSEYICDNDKDQDLAAHLVITKKRGICILGKKIDEVFPEISKKYYFDSILQDSMWSLNNISKGPDIGLCDVPVYAVLNLCRVIAFVREEKILSKFEGAEWGMQKLNEYQDIIQEALNKYLSKPTKKVQSKTLKDFGNYAKTIFEEVKNQIG